MKLKQFKFNVSEYASPECTVARVFLGGGILSASDFGVSSETYNVGSTEDDNWI